MDEKRPPYRLHAPGAAGSAPACELPAYRDARRPRRGPRVDEHEIRPEIERREMVDGEILQTTRLDAAGTSPCIDEVPGPAAEEAGRAALRISTKLYSR